MQPTDKFYLVLIGALFLMAVILITLQGPTFSNDPLIRERQKEAIELEFYEKVSWIRANARELFGWTFQRGKGTANNITFSGHSGAYEIRYEKLRVDWKDLRHLTIFYNDSRVYNAEIRSNSLHSITAYIPGEWINVFNEFYSQALKGLPDDSSSDLKNKWGFT